MLTLYDASGEYPIQNDAYYIRHLSSGLDEVVFEISIWDPLYPKITEEAKLRDRDQQWYLVKQIDGGKDTAKIVAQLDLDDWKATMLVGYSNSSASMNATITNTMPAGWTLMDQSSLTMQRTIEGDYTPMGIVDACRETYGVYFRFDNVAKTITALRPEDAEPVGAFATRELNLREINYKGKSNELVTRLYAYGAEGLSFASINGGQPYVEDHTYTDKVISAVWRDDRYTVAENLLEDAKRNLAAMAVPSRSYDCDVVDLRATNPDLYGYQNFDVFSVATLIDDAKGTSINYQVVERWEYPYYPNKNKVIFSSAPSKIQSQVTHITQQVENPNSPFRQQQQTAMDLATGWITGNKGGYVIFHRNESGQPDEILVMDTPSIATAKNVWRWNSSGLGFSSSGYNGPYTTAITQDGAISADFITTGTLNADIVKTGLLESQNNYAALNMENGQLIFTADGNTEMELWTGGITFRNKEQHIGSFYVSSDNQSIVKADQFMLSDNDQMVDRYYLSNGKSILTVDEAQIASLAGNTSFVTINGNTVNAYHFAVPLASSGAMYEFGSDGLTLIQSTGGVKINFIDGVQIIGSNGDVLGSFDKDSSGTGAFLKCGLISGENASFSGQVTASILSVTELRAPNGINVGGRDYTPTLISSAGESYWVLAEKA